jgi:hypothetical protein
MRWAPVILAVAATVWAARALGPFLTGRLRPTATAAVVPVLLGAIVAQAVLAGAGDAPLAVPAGFAAGAGLLAVRAPMPLAAAVGCALAIVL